jgi:hypothetical protein
MKIYKKLLIIVIFAFFLYEFTVSNGIYHRDTAQTVVPLDMNNFGLLKTTYLFSAHPLYVLIIYSLRNILSFVPVTLLLNQVSIIFSIASIVPLYFFLRRFFSEKTSLCVTLIYIIIPFVWFHSINADEYSLELLFVNLWLYIVSEKKFNNWNLVFSMFLFAILLSIHVVNILLAPLFLFYRRKITVLAFLLILSAIGILVFNTGAYTNLLHNGFFSIFGIASSVALGMWEIFNGLTIVPFILVFIGLIYLLRKNIWLLFIWFAPFVIAFLPGLDAIDGFAPLFPAFIYLMALSLDKFENKKHLLYAVLILVAISIFVKFLPMAMIIHIYESPNEIYTKAIENYSQTTSIVLSGNDCPWLYGIRVCKIEGEYNQTTLDNSLNSSYIITSQFFMNENKYEFLKFGIGNNNTLSVSNLCLKDEITKQSYYEDPYWYFFGLNPSPFYRIVFLGEPAYKDNYKIYGVC